MTLSQFKLLRGHWTKVTGCKCQLLSEHGSSHVRYQMKPWTAVLRSSRNGFKDETVLTLDGRVPGTRRCHWKGSVADRGQDGWWHSKCWHAGRSKMATSINFSGQDQVKWLSEVRRRLLWRQRWTRTHNWNLILSGTFNQRSCRRRGVVFQSPCRVH